MIWKEKKGKDGETYYYNVITRKIHPYLRGGGLTLSKMIVGRRPEGLGDIGNVGQVGVDEQPELLRQAEDELEDLSCRIGLTLISDQPVSLGTIADGNPVIYSESAIREWFRQSRANGRPLQCPQTTLQVTGVLTPEPNIIRDTARFVERIINTRFQGPGWDLLRTQCNDYLRLIARNRRALEAQDEARIYERGRIGRDIVERAQALEEQQAREAQAIAQALEEQHAREAQVIAQALEEQQAREAQAIAQALEEQQAREAQAIAQALEEQQARDRPQIEREKRLQAVEKRMEERKREEEAEIQLQNILNSGSDSQRNLLLQVRINNQGESLTNLLSLFRQAESDEIDRISKAARQRHEESQQLSQLRYLDKLPTKVRENITKVMLNLNQNERILLLNTPGAFIARVDREVQNLQAQEMRIPELSLQADQMQSERTAEPKVGMRLLEQERRMAQPEAGIRADEARIERARQEYLEERERRLEQERRMAQPEAGIRSDEARIERARQEYLEERERIPEQERRMAQLEAAAPWSTSSDVLASLVARERRFKQSEQEFLERKRRNADVEMAEPDEVRIAERESRVEPQMRRMIPPRPNPQIRRIVIPNRALERRLGIQQPQQGQGVDLRQQRATRYTAERQRNEAIRRGQENAAQANVQRNSLPPFGLGGWGN